MEKAIFLDRDGVLNKKPAEHDYVKKWEEMEILPGVKEALSLIKRSGYLVVVITNQRGVARGMMKEEGVHEIHRKLNEKTGNNIDAFYCCFHDNDANCGCRKPKPGLINQAVKMWEIDVSRSWIIGDADSDIEAGREVGVGGIKTKTNEGLLAAVEKILNKE